MQIYRSFVLLFIAALMSACGGSDGAKDSSPPLVFEKMGLGERELHDPVRKPTGALLQPSQTAVLSLESGTTQDASDEDSGTTGMDVIWFEVMKTGSFWISPDAALWSKVDCIEIRNASNATLLTLDAAKPSATLTLAPARYQALIYAPGTATESSTVFAQLAQASAATGAGPRPKSSTWDRFIFMFKDSCEGCDLSGADLRDAKLKKHNLSGANLSGADLQHAKMSESNLNKANLSRAKMSMADFSGVNFRGALLIEAEMIFSKFSWADMSSANLTGANMQSASFYHANLSSANLTQANMRGVDMRNANLTRANMIGAVDMWGGGPTFNDFTRLDGATMPSGTICGPNSLFFCEP